MISNTDQFAEINGNRLRYRVGGEGPLAVFGHGLLGSMEQVGENVPGIEGLHRRIRLLTYDARGHGKSSGPQDSSAYNWQALGEDMTSMASHIAGGQAIFGGGSMGAATALWVALERPERVRGLVLVMPPPLGFEAVRADNERQALKILDVLSAMVANYGLEKTITLVRNIPGFAGTPEEADSKTEWLRRQNPLALRFAIRGLLQSPFHDPECYRGITAPTLVIAHDGDALHPLRAAQLLADTIPDCRLVVAPDAGYWRHNPLAFLAEVHAFLDRLDQA